MLTEPAQFTTEKKKWKYYPIVFAICNSSTPKYLSDHDIGTLNGNSYDGIITNISAISSSIDRDGGLATVGGLTVDLGNLQDYSDWLKTTDIDGSDCQFYLIFNDGTSLVFNESVKFFSGFVDSLEVDYDRISITVSHRDLFEKNIVGDLITSDICTITDNIGKVKPIIYGSHTYNGMNPTSEFDLDEPPSLVPCIDIGGGKYLIAGHELDQIADTSFFIYNKQLNRFFKVDENFGTFTISNPDINGDCVLEHSFAVADGGGDGVFVAWDAWLPKSVTQTNFIDLEFSDIENSVDRKIATYAELDETLDGSDWNLLEFSYPEYDNDYEIMQIRCYTRQDFTGSGATWMLKGDPSVEKKALIGNAACTGTDITFTTAAHTFLPGEKVTLYGLPVEFSPLDGKSFIIATVTATEFTIKSTFVGTWPAFTFAAAQVDSDSGAVDIAEITYGYPQDTGAFLTASKENISNTTNIILGGTGDVNAKLYLIFKYIQIKLNVGGDNILCASVLGKPDSGSSYLKNPADIIKDLAVNHGGYDAADFDSTAFTATQTARTNWLLNPYIDFQQNITEWIQALCKASNIFAFWSNEDKLKLSAYVVGASTSYTAGIDVFSETPTKSVNSFTQNPIKKGSLRLVKTELSEVYNKINIDYTYSPVMGAIYKRKTIENTESQALYGVFEKFFENPYVNNTNTIGYYAANLIDIFAKRLWKATLSARLSAFHCELADVIDVNNLISNDFKFRIHGIGYNPLDSIGIINIECIEARDLSGDTITSAITSKVGYESGVDGISIGGGYTGGGALGEQITFRGTNNRAIRGILFYDQYGRPVYEWRENDSGDKLIRKTSYVKP